VECIGSGSPTVLLEAGFGGGSYLWTGGLPELGRQTRTCAYDRADIGASEAILLADPHFSMLQIGDRTAPDEGQSSRRTPRRSCRAKQWRFARVAAQ